VRFRGNKYASGDLAGETKLFGENLQECHFPSLQIPHDPTWDQTRAAVVRRRPVTASAMTRSTLVFTNYKSSRYVVQSGPDVLAVHYSNTLNPCCFLKVIVQVSYV
jgi:hypothetical protein